MSDPKDDSPKPAGEVVPIEEARRRVEDKAQAEATPAPAEGPAFLKPMMEALARELAGLASPDGVVRIGGEGEAAKAKTAAVVRALGVGLGAALAEAIGKFADKLDIKVTTTPPTAPEAQKQEPPPAAPGAPTDKKPDSNT
jgi:hypothetical protein